MRCCMHHTMLGCIKIAYQDCGNAGEGFKGNLGAKWQQLAVASPMWDGCCLVAQAGKAVFDGPVAVMRNVLQHEGGAVGLFRGLVPTLLREVPGNAAYFGMYTMAKHQLASLQVILLPLACLLLMTLFCFVD